MLPLHVHSSKYPGSGSVLDVDVGRAQRWLARQAKHRTSLLAGALLIVGSLYILWPASDRLRGAIFGSDDTRPDYVHNWPRERRAEAVKEAFTHAYSAYENYAMPADELLPLKNSTIQK